MSAQPREQSTGPKINLRAVFVLQMLAAIWDVLEVAEIKVRSGDCGPCMLIYTVLD